MDVGFVANHSANVESGGKKGLGLVDGKETKVTDLNFDTLVSCASKLQLRDLANMSRVCHLFREAAYSDAIWEAQCRKQWPAQKASWGGIFQYSGGRDAFVSRYIASKQLRYSDPVDWPSHLLPTPISHILLGDDSIAIAQGQNISVCRVGSPTEQPEVVQMLRDHNARITCMRLFPSAMVGACRNSLMGAGAVLVTSSSDHTIRLWGKGRPRTFRGHTRSVNTLADQLLGRGGSSAVLASGGEDGTVRLWSFTSSPGNRGRSPLVATFYGHEQAIKELVVAGHNESLLVSASRDSKIRVYDANAKSPVACAGSIHGPAGVPVKMICDGATCYVAGATTVVAIDLRSMSKVATVSKHEPGILSFARSSTAFGLGTGGLDKTAKLWDLRMSDEEVEPWATLGDHCGPVQCLHMDSYKVVSGGHSDRFTRVWDSNTGEEITALDSIDLDPVIFNCGVSAMAIQGSRIVTGTCGDVSGVVRYCDFSNCTRLLEDSENIKDPFRASKFWEAGFSPDL